MNGSHYDFRKLASARSAIYTQEEFAKLVGVHPVSWSRVENGHSASFEVIARACSLLGIDIRDILRPGSRVAA